MKGILQILVGITRFLCASHEFMGVGKISEGRLFNFFSN